MNYSRLVKVISATSSLFALWGVAAGCGGPSATSFCNRLCDCTGCSDPEMEECIDTLEDSRKEAVEQGCTTQFDASLACANEELTCNGGLASIDGCDTEGDNLSACVATPCEKAGNRVLAKYEECEIEVMQPNPDEDPPECTDSLAAQWSCLADCVETASCATLKGEDPDGLNQYAECVSGC